MDKPKKLDEKEATQVVISLLTEEGPMTTVQIEEKIQKRGEECPDSVALFLSKLRLRGVIGGEVSRERKGWLWWIGEK